MGRYGNIYTPSRTVDWEGDAAMLMLSAARTAGMADGIRNRTPLQVPPFGLHVYAVAARPNNLVDLMDPPDHRFLRTTKPDGDNVIKTVADAMVKGGIIADDCLIAQWVSTCLYVAVGEEPCVDVEFWRARLGPGDDWRRIY